MKVSKVEFTLDCKRATVFFTADGRVDFRRLVRDVSRRFSAKVRMTQIGARDEAGTSLLEVLVALLLTAVGTLAVVPMFVSAQDVNASGADISVLSAKATARMESLRAEPFHHIAAGGSLTSNVTGYADTSDPKVVVRWRVVDGGGPAGTKTIRVRAFAVTEISNQARSVELTTLRSR